MILIKNYGISIIPLTNYSSKGENFNDFSSMIFYCILKDMLYIFYLKKVNFFICADFDEDKVRINKK
jgi:hypothetical protein